ncbi:SdpI family protein [Streptococcus xiaochunlingii]|uniref:SdpI family protein n=1 Tax=Streptococcus xiaochunlingii TaxID=2589788 RepID=UPI002553280D|nr:SdpI family protein [Streptococcus xiaochunlingii]MDK8387300.1 SdpI family protein [Streptococcus xiaochunlingii]MDK8779077.1 SdpI family protein [Streptococcus xiaochunlingii]
MKMNKKLLLLTSIVILFPILWGVMIWSQLPNQISIHFNAAGQANNFQSKALAVFGLPIFLLLVHLFVIFVTARDPKNQTMNEKMGKVIYWLTPIVSLSLSYLIYSKALGSTTNPSIFVSALLGLIFVMMGNYMPKLKVNHTVGIRLPWTLQSEDNWHKTHRLAGKLWVLGGLILLIEAGIQFAVPYVMGIVILTIVLIPILYSYQLSREDC